MGNNKNGNPAYANRYHVAQKWWWFLEQLPNNAKRKSPVWRGSYFKN
jgi:hypothetical protein